MFASLLSQILDKLGYKTAILFMQFRGLKTQNFTWELGFSDSAHPNYNEKSRYPTFFLLKKCPSHAHFHEMSVDYKGFP